MANTKSVTLTADQAAQAPNVIKMSLVAEGEMGSGSINKAHRPKDLEWLQPMMEQSMDKGIMFMPVTKSDLQDWWARKVINSDAYLAIILRMKRMEKVMELREENARTGKQDRLEYLSIDFDQLIQDWTYDDGDKVHRLTTGEIMKSIAALTKKFEFYGVKERQLTLKL